MPCKVYEGPPSFPDPLKRFEGIRISDYPEGHEKRQHMEAAVHLQTLLRHEGEWDNLTFHQRDRLRQTEEGNGHRNEVQQLCAKLRDLGGTAYLEKALSEKPSYEMSMLHQWWLRHEEWDRQREKNED